MQKQTALSFSKDHAGKIVALTFLFTTMLSYTLLGDTHPLPSIALHSTFVFHLERALIISGICYLLWIVFVYTSQGRVPTQIGTTGIGYSHTITGAIRETSEENTELADTVKELEQLMLSELQTKDQVINKITANIDDLYELQRLDKTVMMNAFRWLDKKHIEFQKDLDILRNQGETNV